MNYWSGVGKTLPRDRRISYTTGGGYATMFEPLLGLLTRDNMA